MMYFLLLDIFTHITRERVSKRHRRPSVAVLRPGVTDGPTVSHQWHLPVLARGHVRAGPARIWSMSRAIGGTLGPAGWLLRVDRRWRHRAGNGPVPGSPAGGTPPLRRVLTWALEVGLWSEGGGGLSLA